MNTEQPPKDDHQGGGGLQDDQVQQAKVTYARKVSGVNPGGRPKLNVLDILLERRDETFSYNLSKEELSRLLFRKMGIDPKKVLKIDTSGFGKILIELDKSVQVENFLNIPAFDIKDGVRTKFYRPHHRKDTLVTVSWMDLETPDELLLHVFSHFGKVKSRVQWCKIKEEENESQLAKLLNNILSGERQLWMEVEKPIPSYAILDGRKVKIHHAGQRRTCARCQRMADDCPGQSNARLCEQNGGQRTKVDGVWKETLASIGYSEWIGGDIEVAVEEEASNENWIGIETKYPNCDGVVINNLPEDISNEDVKTLLEGAVLNSSEQVSINPTGSTRGRFIQIMDIKLVKIFLDKIDSKSFRGRVIHCRPHVPTSPLKKNTSEPLEVGSEEKNNLEHQVSAAANKPKDDKVDTNSVANIDGKQPTVPKISNDPKQNGNKIPGLSDEEVKAAIKRKKKNKGRKKAEKVIEPKPRKAGDFLVHTARKFKPDIMESFEFTDYSATEDEYEDSQHVHEDTENISSSALPFSKKLSIFQSSPRSRSSSTSSKRGASPPSREKEFKKPKTSKPSLTNN